MQLLLDANSGVIDSLLVPGLIAAGVLDGNNLVTATTLTKIPIPIDDARKQTLTNTKKIKVRAAFTTPHILKCINCTTPIVSTLNLVATVNIIFDSL
ncbi:MAG: hypothetical protein IPI10_16115 [Bacteroidetes bacterium]|nr:hypothetical protein [Bacteroidota bacterium]